MNNFAVILILGIILRIFLSATSYHPDLQTFNLSGQIISSGHILDLYDYLQQLPSEDPKKTLALFNYPPAIYIFHGIFNVLYSYIFQLWQVNYFLLDVITNYGNPQFNLHLFLLKIPYLIFDLVVAFIFLRLFDKDKDKLLAFTLWIFNPVNLYATYMIGQFDIIPTSFMFLAIYLAYRNKLSLSALTLGFGIAFKIFPIFILPLIILLAKNWIDKFKFGALGLSPYVVSILPFLFSSGFRTNALFADQGSKSLYAVINVSGGEWLFLFPLFLITCYLIFLRFGITKTSLVSNSLIILLLFFIFTHFHPQWLIWITPFLIIDLVKNRTKNLLQILLLFFAYFISLFFFDSSLTVNLFAPLVPGLKNLPRIWEIIYLPIDINYARSATQTILAAASLYLIYINFPSKDYEKQA